MKRTLLIAAFAFVAILLIAAGTGWWYFFHTRAGVEFIVARLDGVKGIHIAAQDVAGTLSGPLTIKRFELDEKHVHIVIEDVELRLTPAAVFARTIRAQYLRVGNATVTVKPLSEPPTDKPIRFLPLWLRVSVGNVGIAKAHIALAGGTALDATDIALIKGVSLNSQRLTVDGASLRSPFAQLSGDVSLLAQRPLGLQGQVLAVTSTTIPAWQVSIKAEGNIESMHIEGQVSAPVNAAINGTLARTENTWQLTGDLTSEQFTLSPWIKQPPFSLTKVDLEIAASLERIVAKGSLIIPEIDPLPMQIEASGKVDKHAVAIEQATLRLGKSNTEVDGQVTIQLGSERQLDANVQWRNLSWPLRSTTGSATGSGQLHSPQGSATLVGSLPYTVQTDADLQLASNQVAHVAASATVSDKVIDVKHYAVSALTGKAQGNANLELAGKRKWRIATEASHINPDFFSVALPGVIDLKANAHGEGFDGREFAIDIDTLRGTLRAEKITGRGSFGRTTNGWYTKAFAASLGDNRVALDGQFGRVNNLTWRIDVPKLEQLLGDTQGQLHSHGTVYGERAVPQFRGQLTAKQVRVRDWHVGELTLDADVDVTGKAPSTLQANAKEFGLGVFTFDTVHLAGSGTDSAHQLQLNATARAEAYESVPTLEWQVQGGYANRMWRGTFSPLKFSDHYGRKPTLTLANAPVSITADSAQAQQLCLILSDRKVCADAAWHRTNGWQLAIASDELELNLFDTLLGDKTQLEGRWQLGGQLSSAGTTPIIGNMQLHIVDAAVLYEAVEDAQERVQVGTGRVQVTSTPQQLDAVLALVTRDTTHVDATMQLKRMIDTPLAQSPLFATLKAHTTDANVLPLFFVDLDHVAGTLQADVTASGTPTDPILRGRIQLQDGELDLYRVNLALRSMNTIVDIDGDHIDFSGNGQLGQGSLNVQGAMQWQDGGIAGQLRLHGKDLLVADLPEYRVVASPDLKFAVDGKRIDASGEVRIPSAHLQPVDLRGAVQRSSDARLVGMQPAKEQSEYQVHSDITVHIGDDVQLNTLGLKGKLAGNVTVITKPNEVARGKGELRVESGRYQAYGQDLDIERGRLLFESSPLDNPGLDILAIRTIEDQEVGVNVRGTLRTPHLSFYSDPSLSQSQTFAYLLTGKPIEDMSSPDAAAVGNASDALALQGSGLLASQLGRRIGLEQMSVESNGLDDTSLVLGKFLSPKLFVSYGISLTESFNTFKARYTLSDRWLLKSEAGEHQSADVEFRIER